MTVLIVGGGISGLALAGALRRAGAEVTVLEQAVEFTGAGSGLSLFGNGFRALDALGLGAHIAAIAASVPPPGTNGTRRPDGRWLTTITERATENLRIVDRSELHTALLSGCAGVTIRTGIRVESADDSGIFLADGTRIDGFDVVIGADGLRSRVRSGWTTTAAPRYAGYGAWRGITTRPVRIDGGGETIGGGRRFGIAPLRDGRVYWFASVTMPESAHPDLAVLNDEFRAWHNPIPELLDATDAETISYLPIEYLHRRLRSYVNGRRVLIGDAAHAMTPDLGQGANQGLEDAAALAAYLRPVVANPTGHAITSALHHFDQERRPRSQTVAKQALLLGRIMQSSGIIAAARNTGMRLMSSSAASAASIRMQNWAPSS